MGTHELSNCPRSTLRDRASRILGVRPEIGIQPPCVTHGRTWNRGAVDGVELSWGTPRTQAWLLRPAGHTGPDLPAVLLLHGHDGVKFYGREKVADGPDGIASGTAALRRRGYDGRSVAEGLVEAGFAVLVHDVFPWGSRRVDWQDFPARAQRAGLVFENESERYEAAAREHEHGLAKAAILRNRPLAGTILREDLLALAVLRATAGIDPNRIAISGFSGGGARVASQVRGSGRAADDGGGEGARGRDRKSREPPSAPRRERGGAEPRPGPVERVCGVDGRRGGHRGPRGPRGRREGIRVRRHE